MAGENEEFNSVIESLLNMFSDVLNKDVIITVAESCGGDLNLAVDAIMKITNDGNTIQDPEKKAPTNNDEPTLDVVQVIPEANKPQVNQNVASHSYSDIIQSSAPDELSSSFPDRPTQQPSSSSATSFQKYGAVPKVLNRLTPIKVDWNDQIRRIIENHNKGSRTLILMRGAPGSGKTQLAQKIVEMIIGGTFVNFRTHICSTDDYFMTRGHYFFNKHNLSEAHAWNQNRAVLSMNQGLSPLIIDNTNIELWEMEPYVRSGVKNGYIIEVVEPNTSWAKKPNQLARKNIHNVPIGTIRRMLDNYENNITGDTLLKRFGLSYPSDRIPPVLRTMPAFEITNSMTPSTSINFVPNNANKSLAESYTMPLQSSPYNMQYSIQSGPQNIQQNIQSGPQNIQQNIQSCPQNIHPNVQSGPTNIQQNVQCGPQNIQQNAQSALQNIEASYNLQSTQHNVNKPVAQSSSARQSPEHYSNEKSEVGYDFEIIQDCNSPIDINTEQDDNVNLGNQYLDIQKQLEEIEKVEQEWENGEHWEEVSQTNPMGIEKDSDPNCPKPPRSQTNTEEDLIDAVSNVKDWRQISMFMPPWHNETTEAVTVTEIPVETTTSGTSMDIGDFDQLRSNLKIISASSRDINFFHISTTKEKIPDKRMLDKSTMTNEQQLITDASKRCLNEEKHFSAFRKLFRNINKAALRDIFDQCMGDVNWAVEIVLDGVAANQIETVEDEQMSDEDVSDDTCTCLSAYHIVPDTSASQPEVPSQPDNIAVLSETPSTPVQKKASRRDVTPSDASVELKRQIEQNVVIADSHYSQHCLKIMRFRRGYTENTLDENQPSTSQCPDIAAGGSDDEEESNGSAEEVEKTVNVTLGKEFVTELDMLFGRTDMSYPDSLVPKINIPISLLNEINALWMESLMHQLDEHERQRAKMLQEDEDFARALALKEAELAMAGKLEREPEVLDFKEIMDMDLALSIYQRDVAGWRNKEPNDLAAKLTRDKLYSLFPDVPNDILAELLMAHENKFENTVEVLLLSTGRGHILKEKNGLNKFIMNAEMERQAKILEEERKALSEVEWPLLPKGEVPDMAAVNEYRVVADRHLQSRNTNIQKASAYLSRGMINVAGYYKELAEFHKLKFEQSNSLAAASLMQLHAAKCPDTATIDLHYLRVSEAKESMDLFIDTHIQKLKSNQGRGVRHHTLYFITGRGLHSNGRPRIKPAVKKRLQERGLFCGEVNPGLLSTRVCADNALSHEVA